LTKFTIIDLIVFFFFQKKKQKAFVLRSTLNANPRQSRPRFGGRTSKTVDLIASILLFPEKEAKSVCSAKLSQLETSAKPTQGVWGLAPKIIALIVPFKPPIQLV
jgi:hypothetical protein